MRRWRRSPAGAAASIRLLWRRKGTRCSLTPERGSAAPIGTVEHDLSGAAGHVVLRRNGRQSPAPWRKTLEGEPAFVIAGRGRDALVADQLENAAAFVVLNAQSAFGARCRLKREQIPVAANRGQPEAAMDVGGNE